MRMAFYTFDCGHSHDQEFERDGSDYDPFVPSSSPGQGKGDHRISSFGHL
jgi:hypothetical protein